ncbi:hypothetical protein FDECE_7757 [Fusarium decemcellulare]|nr:hypothetical protein FDECE_7757 [Fusarium decemcellulare]
MNGESVDIMEFLSSDKFILHVDSLSEAQPDPASLKGIRSSLKLASSDFRGGFLCDSMGLGKSLTALIAAVNIRKESLPNCGFILVVCKPGCLVQWYDEVQKHFDKDSRPACLIPDSTNIPVPRLLQYDVVICSGFFLKERFNDWFLFKNFCLAVHDVGLDRAREVFGHQLKRPFSPLYSSLYDQLSRNIAVLIVDESHECKTEESVLNAAVRSLKYQYAFLLTGTPIYNTWEDLLGQTKLLPCGLFADKEHFQGLFARLDR